MTTTTIDELELGDKVVIQTGKNEVEIHDVIEINYTDYFIISKESSPMDISIENPEEIIILNKL